MSTSRKSASLSQEEISVLLSNDSSEEEEGGGDVSFMNTEPLKASGSGSDEATGTFTQMEKQMRLKLNNAHPRCDSSELDAEYADEEAGSPDEEAESSDEEAEATDEEVESADGETDEEETGSKRNTSTLPSPSTIVNQPPELSGSGSDDEEDIPLPDLTMAPSHERKQAYYELLHKTRGMDETIHTEVGGKLLKDNIAAADTLFQQMNNTLLQEHDSQNVGTGLGSSASEVLLAVQHTKACSEMLYHKVKTIGSTVNVFDLQEFLDNIANAFVDDNQEYCEKLAVKRLAEVCDQVSSTHFHFSSIYNGMGNQGFVQMSEPAPPKETRVRRNRVVKEKDGPLTQSEVINTPQASKDTEEFETDTPEGLAKDIVRTVKTRFLAEGETPQNLLEVCQASSVSETVTRLFGAAFCARDGYVGVTTRDDVECSEIGTALMLRPEKPPKKAHGVNDGQRGQVIASYPAALLKMISENRTNQ